MSRLPDTTALAVADAIARRLTAAEIQRRRQDLAKHMQWMFTQRRCLERMIQLAGNEGFLVEASDKCGDSCLYLPADMRISSDNVGKYKYRLSLQANVYAGKLFHLSFLLPSLVTGQNFGMTSASTRPPRASKRKHRAVGASAAEPYDVDAGM